MSPSVEAALKYGGLCGAGSVELVSANMMVGPALPSTVIFVSGTGLLENRTADDCREKLGRTVSAEESAVGAGSSENVLLLPRGWFRD